MRQGNIILLNGTSSSGKTTIAQVLQEVMDVPYLHTGLDQFLLDHLPSRLVVFSDDITPTDTDGWLAIFRDEILSDVRLGPTSIQWITGMYRAVAALAQEGLHVIMDDAIYDPRVLKAAVDTLPAQQVYFVGIYLPLEVAEERERERGNRALGGARTFYDLVHVPGIYDLEIDSAANSPMECAQQIQRGLLDRNYPSAFSLLRASFTDSGAASNRSPASGLAVL